MAQRSVADRIAEAVREPLTSLGLGLWDVRYVKEGASWYLRVYIDKECGVDINDCTDASHLIDPILDELDIISNQYYFEVCSPGLERELTRPEHFEKMLGREVRLILIRPVDGKKEITGTLSAYKNGTVTVTSEGAELSFGERELAKVKLSDI